MRFFHPTILGLIALAIWTTSIAFTRTLSETIGPVMLGAVSFGFGGLLALGLEFWRYRKIRVLSPPSRPYLIFCGFFYVVNIISYVLAFALARNRQVALQLGIVNFLWPALLILGSVFMLKYRARWIFLAPGLMISVAGMAICMAGRLSLSLFANAVRENAPAFVLMACSAASWAVYSNCAHKYAPKGRGSGVPLFEVITGLIFLIYYAAFGGKPVWTPAVIGPLAYYTVFVAAASYLIWDIAMQRGNIVLLGVVSYLLPLASTLFAAWHYQEPVGLHLLAGAALVMLGAVLSRCGVVSKVSY
jgi:drug/metabolite transporter (DMT)-like permease